MADPDKIRADFNTISDRVSLWMGDETSPLSTAVAAALSLSYHDLLHLLGPEERKTVWESPSGVRVAQSMTELREFLESSDGTGLGEITDRWIPIREGLRTLLLHFTFNVGLD